MPPRKFSCTPFYFLSFLPMLPPVSPGNHWSAVYYKFNSHYYLEILSCFVSIINSFYCWAVFHCMDITQFVIMLSCWWMDIKQILTFDLQQKVKTVLWILLLFQSGCLLVLSFSFFLPYCTGMDVWFLKCFFFFLLVSVDVIMKL